MGDVFGAFFTVIVGMAILAAFLGGLYFLTRYLPGGWRERGQVLVFVGPAVFLVFAGLFVPAMRTLWVSFLDDRGKSWVGLDNYHEIFSGKGTRLILFNSLHVGGRWHPVRRHRRARHRPLRRRDARRAGGEVADLHPRRDLAGRRRHHLEVRLRRPAVRGRPAQPGHQGDPWAAGQPRRRRRQDLARRSQHRRPQPAGLGAGPEHVPADRHLHLGLGRVGHGLLLGGDQGRSRGADRGRPGRRGDQAPGVLQGDAAVHQRHRGGRRHDHGDRRASRSSTSSPRRPAATSARARSPTSSTGSTSSRVATASDRRTRCCCSCW